MYGRSVWLAANVWEMHGDAGRMQFQSFDVYREPGRHPLWHCSFDVERGERRIDDSRTGERIHSKAELTSVHRDLLTFPAPAFGEYEDVMTRLRSLLRAAGYGEMT
jgi:hypothetical protein